MPYNVLPVDKVVRRYRRTSSLLFNLYKFTILPDNWQTEPFYLPAVIRRWSAGREGALANAFMASFCIFFKTKADGHLQVQSVLAVGSVIYFFFGISWLHSYYQDSKYQLWSWISQSLFINVWPECLITVAAWIVARQTTILPVIQVMKFYFKTKINFILGQLFMPACCAQVIFIFVFRIFCMHFYDQEPGHQWWSLVLLSLFINIWPECPITVAAWIVAR